MEINIHVRKKIMSLFETPHLSNHEIARQWKRSTKEVEKLRCIYRFASDEDLKRILSDNEFDISWDQLSLDKCSNLRPIKANQFHNLKTNEEIISWIAKNHPSIEDMRKEFGIGKDTCRILIKAVNTVPNDIYLQKFKKNEINFKELEIRVGIDDYHARRVKRKIGMDLEEPKHKKKAKKKNIHVEEKERISTIRKDKIQEFIEFHPNLDTKQIAERLDLAESYIKNFKRILDNGSDHLIEILIQTDYPIQKLIEMLPLPNANEEHLSQLKKQRPDLITDYLTKFRMSPSFKKAYTNFISVIADEGYDLWKDTDRKMVLEALKHAQKLIN